ncbi:hypothetical protein CsSME_00037565 [Camellia sinensis var. sinensis]
MEITSKDERGGAPVLDIGTKSTVGGGGEDVYGEDRATEGQPVTPWTFGSLHNSTHHTHHRWNFDRDWCCLL